MRKNSTQDCMFYFHMYNMFERERLMSQTCVSGTHTLGGFPLPDVLVNTGGRNCSSHLMVVSPLRGRTSDDVMTFNHPLVIMRRCRRIRHPDEPPKAKLGPVKLPGGSCSGKAFSLCCHGA